MDSIPAPDDRIGDTVYFTLEDIRKIAGQYLGEDLMLVLLNALRHGHRMEIDIGPGLLVVPEGNGLFRIWQKPQR